MSSPTVRRDVPAPSELQRSARRRRQLNDLSAYLFMSPYLLLFVLFLLIPAVMGVVISFTNWDILGTPTWRGLGNYVQIFRDPLFRQAVTNTFMFMLLTAVPLVVVGLGLAVLLNQKLRGRGFVRTVVFLPYVVTVSAVGILWVWMYDKTVGLINYVLSLVGLAPVAWLTDTHTALTAIAVATLWWTVNVNMIIYLAGLQDIPRELGEAAEIDGATPWLAFWRITLPLLQPVHAFVIPLTVISAWRVFGQVYSMTKGGPEGSTYVIAQYTYLTAFQNFQMGPAAAAGVVLLLITLAFSLVQLRAMRVL
ncbi:carbohydrate ABC transporter permease [Deinococcus sp.]|uniref:carbohydrate ABC transporter permease n=1 Tax=Deinococcus sp. TaxID=47478 RepID=UPI003CC5F6A6